MLAPLLVGVAERQATSKTARAQALLSRRSPFPEGSAAPVPGSFLHANVLLDLSPPSAPRH